MSTIDPLVKDFLAQKRIAVAGVSPEAVKLCRENNIAVIPGDCPMMFCEPVDFGHKCMRWSLRLIGNLGGANGLTTRRGEGQANKN